MPELRAAPSPYDDLLTDPDRFASTFGEALRRGRHRRAWTQAALAEAAGISSNYVARLERGELSPSLLVAVRLAKALETSIEALLVRARGRASGRI